MTDGEGKFAFGGLDPELLFELLVVAEKHVPAYTDKDTDPRLGAVEIALEARDLAREPAGAVVRGQVVDARGDPIRRAVLRPVGKKLENGLCLGAVTADPLAVTNARGEFELLAGEPGMTVWFQVSAVAYADRMSGWFTAGADDSRVALDRGATVSGRVEQDGKPVAGVELALAQQNRDNLSFLGERTVGTDAAGRFTFVNVPAENVYWLFGKSASLVERGALSARALKVGAVESTADAGVLALEPGLRLAGRVVTSDKSELPKGTQLRLVREDVQDVQFATVAADGTFAFPRVPRELVSLMPLLRTYRVSPVNASHDFLNQAGLLGRVDGDTELELVLDPLKGEEEGLVPDMKLWERYEALMKSTLRGKQTDRGDAEGAEKRGEKGN